MSEDLYSRSAGLIENDALQHRRVLIVGLGSFGSQIAVDFAKSAVGQYALMDFDRLEHHNVVRHACLLRDVGRLKTDAVEELIFGKNPYAKVEKFPIDVNERPEVLEGEIAKADIVICATDNNQSRFRMSEIVARLGKVCIYGRANTRAEGGDVFIQRPGGPCYNCLVGTSAYDVQAEEVSSRESGLRSGRIAAYTSPEDAEAIVQVGLAVDIAPITNMMVKLALVELSKGTGAGLSALEGEFTYDYWMWANRRERRFRQWAPFNRAGHLPTILRWYGVRIPKEKSCPICGSGDSLVLEE